MNATYLNFFAMVPEMIQIVVIIKYILLLLLLLIMHKRTHTLEKKDFLRKEIDIYSIYQMVFFSFFLVRVRLIFFHSFIYKS